MASLADSLASLGSGRREYDTTRCPVGRLLRTLEADDATALLGAVDNLDVTAVNLAHVLRSNGHLISADAVRRHRRGACSCPHPADVA